MIQNTEDHLQDFRDKCRKNRLKITPQRTGIYEELNRASDHPTADQVYNRVKKRFPHISFDTVYRTLQSFSDIGVVKIVEGYGNPRRFDTDTGSHHHMRCVRCHKIIDFYNREYDEIPVPEDIKEQFHVLDKKVILEGICDDCAE